MIKTNAEIIEEILSHFGRTGAKKRPRIRKFHAELLYGKYLQRERVISQNELKRPKDYIDRIVKYSKGFLEYINEEETELQLTDFFFKTVETWVQMYSNVEELDYDEKNLLTQGIIFDEEDNIKFDSNLTYSRFYKLISDEGEALNDPSMWKFNDIGLSSFAQVDFNKKNSPIFSSKLVLLKFYVLRKIDEVAFVTSRFVHCPACNSHYVVPAAKIEFQTSFKCENKVGDKECRTTLKKFPARKMIPTHIYEVGVEVKTKAGVEFREFFLESFKDLHPGYYTGQVFGRTESSSNSFYFTCITAKEEKSKIDFEILETKRHKFLDIVDSVVNHIKKIGFVIDDEKARLPMIIETIKKLNLVVNKEVNLDHSLYFGAPGIGKTYAVLLLHHMFYSNSGFVSGPRFTLPGLTGGQKEIFYQDTSKKKSVPGLFSNEAFIFDEINNAQFLSDDKAVNLFKSVALAASGTSTTVGGKEFRRVSLIAGTANYDIDHLRHYENKVRKIYKSEKPDASQPIEQSIFLEDKEKADDIPITFDFYKKLKDYDIDVKKELKVAILKVRDEAKNYLTNFPKPLMERFYWSILVHPKYDKAYMKQKKIDVEGFLKSRKSEYGQREMLSQLFIPDFDKKILSIVEDTIKRFDNEKIEKSWSKEVQEFLSILAGKYVEFFSMFHRINQVHVFTLYTLCVLNGETHLSFESKRIFEKLVSLCHTPIEINEFHKPDFENYHYVGETKGELLEIIKRFPDRDIRDFVDYDNRPLVRKNIADLQNNRRIEKISTYRFKLLEDKDFQKVETNNKL